MEKRSRMERFVSVTRRAFPEETGDAADERRALEDLAARLRDLELAAKPARGRGLRAGAAAEAS